MDHLACSDERRHVPHKVRRDGLRVCLLVGAQQVEESRAKFGQGRPEGHVQHLPGVEVVQELG